MILVLKGADFSANNLGQVEITTELNEFTKAAIVASGNTSMSEEQKSALDTFFRNIGAFGGSSEIFSKIERMYIPFICGGISFAGHDFAEKNSGVTLSAEAYALRNKGITGALESPTANCPKIPMLVSKRDFSFFLMTTEQIDNNNQGVQVFFSYNGNSGANRFYAQMTSPGGGNVINIRLDHLNPSSTNLIANVMQLNSDYSTRNYGLLAGFSLTGNNQVKFITLDERIESVTYPNWENIGDDTEITNANVFGAANAKALSSKSKSIGMFLLGSGLSEDEMVSLKKAADKLASYFVM